MRASAIGLLLLYLGVLMVAHGLVWAELSPVEEQAKIEDIRRTIEENGYTWSAGHTSVSQLTDEEFERLLGLRVPPDYEERRQRASLEGRLIRAPGGMYFPPSLDWRDQNGVTPVKNQGNCGSCWAFSATGAFESAVLIYSGLEEDLSEQAVVSCNTAGDDCGGGWMETAYDLFISDGAVRETCMAYHAVDTDFCIQPSCEVVAYLDSYYYVDDNVDAIKTALLNGPVACAIAVCGGFSSYTGGCYEENCTEINHGVLLVGWDDDMCNGEGAWIMKNSWGPDWGEGGYMYIKYGANYIGYATDALNYTPDQTVHFFLDSYTIDDSAGDGDGFPESGETIVFAVTVLNVGAETATNVSATLTSLTPGVTVADGSAIFADIEKGTTQTTESPHFTFTITPGGPSCGAVTFQMEVSSDQGASARNITVNAGEVIAVFADDLESDLGWTAGLPGDDAVTGMWERGDPNATYVGPEEVQPEDDHTSAPGTQCYFTGQSAPGASQGANDVDGGRTTLESPVIDLSGKDSAVLTYYRYYASNTGSAPNDDDFIVNVSNDDGLTWHNLETLSYTERAWIKREFYLEDYIALTDEMKFRFVAKDSSPGSIVEAAVDDLCITACSNVVIDTEDPSVEVISPNGGEIVYHSTVYDVTWSASDNIGVVSVCILVSTDAGATFPDTVAAEEENDGTYEWTVPDMDSRTARLKVVACDGAANEGEDISDADFTLWGSQSGIDDPAPEAIPEEISVGIEGGMVAAEMAAILFGLPVYSEVRMECYDVAGRRIASLHCGSRKAGYHRVNWNCLTEAGEKLSPGIYFLRLQTDGGSAATKVVIAR